MGQRADLNALLKTITDNVYFQPPSNVQLNYPCIVYQRDYSDNKFAGNKLYHRTKRYLVTVIDRDPDSSIPDQIAELPLCAFDRFFVAENLNHDVFSLYF